MANQDIFESGSTWLADQLKANVSKSITYRRGTQTVTLRATIGQSVFEVENASNIVETIQSRDYLINTADLVLNGVTVLPERGDSVLEVFGSKTNTYEVMAQNEGPAWSYSDRYQLKLRIHTKQILIKN